MPENEPMPLLTDETADWVHNHPNPYKYDNNWKYKEIDGKFYIMEELDSE